MSFPLSELITGVANGVRRLRTLLQNSDGEEIFTDDHPGSVNVKGSIPEYGPWLDTDDPKPDPGDDGYDRALGIEIEAATGEMSLKYWDGGPEWKAVG